MWRKNIFVSDLMGSGATARDAGMPDVQVPALVCCISERYKLQMLQIPVEFWNL